MTKKPNIAICISCFGMGHFTQAITVANYIKDEYTIKSIFCTCPADIDERTLMYKIKKSILYKDTADICIFKTSHLQTHEVNNKPKLLLNYVIYNTMNTPEITYYLLKYDIQLIIDFFTNNINVLGYPTINIARQYISMKRDLDNSFTNTTRGFNSVNAGICLSHDDIRDLHYNSIVDFDIPPLIDTVEIKRNIIPNTCLVYIRDALYCNDLNTLIKNNPDIAFSVFTNHTTLIEPLENVHVSLPNNEFKDKLTTTQIIITSSGVETVCEAFYNDIPIIVFRPDERDEEQSYNYNYYIKNKMAVPFTRDIDILNIARQPVDNVWFKNYCRTANDKIHKIITHVTKRPSIIKGIFAQITKPMEIPIETPNASD
jgi:hypothetical protein